MPAGRDEPTPLEKKHQLERILASETFKRARKPAKLLKFIVEADLGGTPTDEDTLGVELFERRKDWIPLEDSIVRENLRRLRNLLEQYYVNYGRQDWLLLELPGYKSVFSYNPTSWFEQYYHRALRYVSNDPKAAFSLLHLALNIEPNHAGALAAWAETELWRPLYGYDIALPEILSAAEGRARQALQSNGAYWRAHVVMGALHCCRREWGKATQAFRSALNDSPEETSVHPWYAVFLMATGKTGDALLLVEALAHEEPASPWAQVTYAIFLYVAREFQEAKQVLRETLRLHDDLWLANVIWSCVCLALDGGHEAVPGMGMSSRPRLPEGALVYPALSILCDIEELPSDHPDYLLLKSATEAAARNKLGGWEPPEDTDRRPYIGELCLTPCQLAVGYMALGEPQRAIALLRRDLDRNHPLMVWLHLWPLFDSLRTHKDFKRLIQRMNHPNRS